MTGKLLPGAKLDEASLSERFGLSRTPIREALRFLSERGMVELIEISQDYQSSQKLMSEFRKLDRAAKQQQLLGQRGLARIRVGNDRECAPARYIAGKLGSHES